MNFWDKITGADMTRELKAMEARSRKLSADYIRAWEVIKANLWLCDSSDITGRASMAILNNALCLLEETAAAGQSIEEVFGGDIKSFCAALTDVNEASSYRDKWREQLNNSITKKLGKLEGKR